MNIGEIEISNMEFYAFHGCYHEEKIVGNKFIVDFSYRCDVEPATKSDSIHDTISYLDVYEIIKKEMMQGSNLIEHVASRSLNAVINRYVNILSATIRISKMTPPLGGDVERVSIKLSYTKQ